MALVPTKMGRGVGLFSKRDLLTGNAKVPNALSLQELNVDLQFIVDNSSVLISMYFYHYLRD